MSKAKGNIFSLVLQLEPALSFGQVRQRLRRVSSSARPASSANCAGNGGAQAGTGAR
jgi:hypothetical protein